MLVLTIVAQIGKYDYLESSDASDADRNWRSMFRCILV